jgi:hypothetical protein
MRKLLLLLSLVVIIGLGGLLFNSVETQSKIDICLDNGGSFNYQACICDYENTHPYESDNQCDG